MKNEVLVQEYVAQKFAIGRAIHLKNFDGIGESATTALSMAVDRAVLGFKAWCLAEVHESKSVGAWRYKSWWDHFKADHAPARFLSRWPAQKDEWLVFEPKTIRVCPHIHIPSAKNNTEIHLAYLNRNDGIEDPK